METCRNTFPHCWHQVCILCLLPKSWGLRKLKPQSTGRHVTPGSKDTEVTKWPNIQRGSKSAKNKDDLRGVSLCSEARGLYWADQFPTPQPLPVVGTHLELPRVSHTPAAHEETGKLGGRTRKQQPWFGQQMPARPYLQKFCSKKFASKSGFVIPPFPLLQII